MASQSAQSEYPPYYPNEGTYADLLRWHMDYWGTRSTGSTSVNGIPWKGDEFRRQAFGNKWDEPTFITGMRNWRGAGSAPNENNIESIEDALFGKAAIFDLWRRHLKATWERSRGKNKNTRTVAFPPPPPPGSIIWIGPAENIPSPWRLQMVKNEALSFEKLGNISDEHDVRQSYYERAFTLFNALDDLDGQRRCLALLGHLHYGALKLDMAQERYSETLALFPDDSELSVTKANCISGLAQICFRKNAFEEAYRLFAKAYAQFEILDYSPGLASCLEGFANLALARQDDEAATPILKRARLLYKSCDMFMGEANIIFHLASIASRKDDGREAVILFDEAISIYEKAGSLFGKANCLNALSDIFSRLGLPGKAQKCLLQATELYRQSDDR